MPVQTPPEMRALQFDLSTSVWMLAAVGALYEAGLVEHLREPKSADDLASACPNLPKSMIERSLQVAAAAGVVVTTEDHRFKLAEGAMAFSQPPLSLAVQGDIRATLMQALVLIDTAKGAKAGTPAKAGFHHTNATLLQAIGDMSAGFPPIFKQTMVGSMGDLASRLEQPTARFLDVGVGVGALAISMCRAFPAVHVVGLDKSSIPLDLANANIARAKMTDRILARNVAIEDFRDEDAFDLAWLPSFFFEDLARAVTRAHAALRKGGFILIPVLGTSGSDTQRAVGALITELWGGPVISVADTESIMTKVGFTSVRTVVGPAWSPALVMGQR